MFALLASVLHLKIFSMDNQLLKYIKNSVILFFYFSSLFQSSKLIAQTYYEDFETLTKNSYSSATVTLNAMDWNFTGSNSGNGVNDFKIELRSARLAGSSSASSNSDTSKMEMLNNKLGGIGEISFLYKKYGTDAQKQWAVQWSSDGIVWNTIDTIVASDSIVLFSYSLNEINARIRIFALDFTVGSINNHRFNIDSLVLTNAPLPPSGPSIIGKSPEGISVSLAINELIAQFDKDIQVGNGMVYLHKIGGGVQSFSVPSSSVSILDSTLTISGINLENTSNYYVTIDSGIVFNTTNLLSNAAVIDTAFWTFSTIDTIGPPALTELNESFANCNNTTNSLGGFFQYNMEGTSIWKCTPYARNDANAVFISGGYSTGISEPNEDWLISKQPFDFSAMNHPVLSLYQKSRFNGVVELSVKISTDYSGNGNPNLANWINLNVPEMQTQPVPVNEWLNVDGIDLSAYKNSKFFLAFTYKCDSTGAFEISYDDIKIQDATAINVVKNQNVGVNVIGKATRSEIILQCNLGKAGMLGIQLIDLTGRVVEVKQILAIKGENRIALNNLSLNGGLYVIRVQNERSVGVVKVVVR